MNWRILCYHTVDPQQAKTFADQLRWFRNHGQEFRSFSEGFASRTAVLIRPCITVSFDDGDWSACGVAQKVLADEGIKAILYITTDYVLRGETYRAKVSRPAANWQQLGSWLQEGHEIGGHTHTHTDLTTSIRAQWEDELGLSRQIIQRELGVDAVHFAYPWGRYNQGVCQWLKSQSHWCSAATVNGRANGLLTDSFVLGRSNMTADWDEPRMQMILQPLGVRMARRLGAMLKKLRRSVVCTFQAGVIETDC